MQRFHQFVFSASLLAVCWLAMIAVHELGHVVGAWVTGGSVERVVLYPLAISRTDVSPNPHPGIVVWLGPIVGAILPLALFAVVPRRLTVLRNVARFFAGFCLIANGGYIAYGAIDGVGDCGEMLRNGTPQWVLYAFGAVTIPLGLSVLHSLGSLHQFINKPPTITPRMTYLVVSVLLLAVVIGFTLSPR
ncbi:MAG: hypothetical protein HON53_16910 [Planctomycetaceae bacterium]|jgi:hypothetical protein|nr:hypothetical protein [Planctomycetaceae bacterium]MBT6157186.1 hypothetical protein [Planctomycetaceae bacterium]MBT6486967.1 hypothetical protein [Planctomycetaceae bacterium]MBT6492999.1 hypothetical protein [Planctomycetaceae bacterium]